MRSLILVLGLVLTGLATASDTYRSGSRVISVGDSATKLAQLIGLPALKVPIENKQGGFEGERWQYTMDDKTVTFVIRNGNVSAIDEVHD